VAAYLGVLQLQVVLELVNIHKSRNRDAILFQDDILFVEVDLLDDSSQVDTCFGNGQMVHQRRCGLGSGLTGHTSDSFRPLPVDER
jgi:hypothetical protein